MRGLRGWVWWQLRTLWRTSAPALLIGQFALIFVGMVTWLVFYVGDSKREGGWLIALLSALASALLAVVVGLFLFKLQAEDTQRDRKQEMTRLLRHELEEVLIAVQEKP